MDNISLKKTNKINIIPQQIAKLHKINKGNTMESSPSGTGKLKIKKMEK